MISILIVNKRSSIDRTVLEQNKRKANKIENINDENAVKWRRCMNKKEMKKNVWERQISELVWFGWLNTRINEMIDI